MMNTVTFKGTPVQIEGAFPLVGQISPNFLLIDSSLNEKSLNDFPETKLLLIVPSLDTPVCSTCSKKFNDLVGKEKKMSLLIISADLPFAQKRYCGAENISNATTLSMMRDKSFAKDYGVLINSGPLAGLCCRAVILLDKDNKVLYAERVSEITQEPDYEKISALI